MIAAALLALVLVFAIYRLASDYVRRSLRSFAYADRVRADLRSALVDLVEAGVPPSVAQLAGMMGTAAGCGCLVRGLLMGHFLPRFFLSPPRGESRFKGAFEALEKLGADERKLFDRVMVTAIVYDSFRNPFQGWIFRHLLTSLLSPDPSYSAKLEAQLATASVLSRRHVAA